MTTWSFTLVLNREPTEPELDALFEAGLDDSGPEGALLHVDRDADSLLDAAWSAARDVAKVPGLHAIRLAWDDIVTLREIAQRTDRTYEGVRLLVEGRRGPGGFPDPLVDTKIARVWSWADVASWFEDNMPAIGISSEGTESASFRHAADAVIRLAAAYAEANPADKERIAAVIHEVA